ncbi:MAG: hypothetical protein PHE73_08595 [Sulfurovaceae bacterium]|nr:hypothetical protein [Sulfurovaceae bacterium]
MREIMSRLCNISDKSYYVWRKKSHIKLIMLIEKYFTKKDLEEFLSTGKISKYEGIKQGTQDLILSEVQNNSKMLSELLEALKTSGEITK